MADAARTRLIEDPTGTAELTSRGDTDTISALTRGLAEYLGGLQVDMEGGRLVRLDPERVLDHWADLADVGESSSGSSGNWPAACVYPKGEGTYEANSLARHLSADDLVRGTADTYLLQPSELTITLIVEVWCTDPVERAAVCRLIEDAAAPVEWMAGFRLLLPHYHDARADYLLQRTTWLDSTDSAGQRRRVAQLSVLATVPQLRVLHRPLAQPVLKTRVGEDPPNPDGIDSDDPAE